MLTAPPRRAGGGGFSMIELLAVLVVIVILGALIMPAMQGLSSSGNLRGGADGVVAQLDLAQQTAAARDVAVNVRLYEDTSKPPDTNGHFPYRLLALVIPVTAGSSGSDEFITAPRGLNGDVIFDSSTTYSSILNTGLGATGLQPVAATELASAPATVRNLPALYPVYLPPERHGQPRLQPAVDPDPDQPEQGAKKSDRRPGSHFVTLTINPQTSHVSIYQP